MEKELTTNCGKISLDKKRLEGSNRPNDQYFLYYEKDVKSSLSDFFKELKIIIDNQKGLDYRLCFWFETQINILKLKHFGKGLIE